jgi:hypothetical protein
MGKHSLEKNRTKNEKSIEKELVELHQKFLDTIKEVYPLAVLGSLCVAIAAFTKETYPNAQVFAIAAASLFLIAFAVSLLAKIMPNIYLVIISFASTGIAIMFLFLVITEFSRVVSVVSTSLRLIQIIPFVFVLFVGGLFFYRTQRDTKSRAIHLLSILGIPLVVFNIISYLFNILSYLMVFDVPIFTSQLSLEIFALVSLVLMLILVTSIIAKKKAKEQEQTILP